MRARMTQAMLVQLATLVLLMTITASSDSPLAGPPTAHSIEESDNLQLNEAMSDRTSYEGDTAFFNCEVTGSPKPVYSWFKDEAPLEIGDLPRISHKTMLWGSRLRIDRVQKQDEGHYRCTGRNRFSEASTEAHLVVLSGPNPSGSKVKSDADLDPDSETIDPDFDIKPIYPEFPGKQKKPKNKNADEDLDAKSHDDAVGFCQSYIGSSCSKYLGNQSIFVLDTDYQRMHEEWISGHLSTLEKVGEISYACKQFLVPILCLITFPTCSHADVDAGRKSSARSSRTRKLCRDDCDLVKSVHCREEYSPENLLRWASPPHNIMEKFKYENVHKILGLANCTDLKTMQRGGACNSAGIPSTSPYEDSKCYSDDGYSYRGLVHKTKTRDTCLRWSDVGSYHEPNQINSEPMDHNLCRNPDRSLSGPWCFVEAEVGHAKELCNVDPCDQDSRGRYRNGLLIGAPCSLLLIVAVVVVVCARMKSKRRREKEDKKNKTRNPADKSETQSLQQHQLQSQHGKKGNLQMKSLLDRQSFQSSAAAPPYIAPGNVSLNCELFRQPCGRVYRGEILSFCSPVGGPVAPAVFRTLDPNCPPKLQLEFWKEVDRTCDFRHPNVTAVLGLNKTSQPNFVAYEASSYGDLNEYLRHNSEPIAHVPDFCSASVGGGGASVLPQTVLVSIAVQVASALEFLHSKSYVHGELNSYNVFVCDSGVVKISLVVPGSGPNHLVSAARGRPAPLRWQPPEVLADPAGKGSDKADVWSFGVLLWEIYSCASVPYGSLSDMEASEAIKSFRILPCPGGCPAGAYATAVQCWHEVPAGRLTASELHDRLRQSWAELNAAPPSSSTGSNQSSQGINVKNSSGNNDDSYRQPMPQPALLIQGGVQSSTPTRLISSHSISSASQKSSPSSSACNVKRDPAPTGKSRDFSVSNSSSSPVAGRKCYFSNEVYTEQIV